MSLKLCLPLQDILRPLHTPLVTRRHLATLLRQDTPLRALVTLLRATLVRAPLQACT